MFPTQEAGDFFNPNYVFIKYDLDKADPDKINETYGIRAYPTFIFLNGNGEEVIRMLGGGKDTPSFINRVKENMKPENSFKARYQKFQNDPSYAMTYIQFLEDDCYMSKEADKLLSELFEKRSIAENFTKGNMDFYSKKVSSVKSPIFQMMITKEPEVKAAIGENAYNSFMQDKGIQFLSMQLFARKFDAASLDKVIASIESTKQLQSDYTKFVIANKKVIVDKNVEALAPLALKAIKKMDQKSCDKVIGLVLSSIPRDNKELSKTTALSLYAVALKGAKDAETIKKYEGVIESIKNPKPNSMPAMRMM